VLELKPRFASPPAKDFPEIFARIEFLRTTGIELSARKWTFTKRRGGRRGVLLEIRRLAVRMAKENPTWGYTRIVGALTNVGHRVSRSTIARILKAHGIPPVPERPTSWQTFLQAHWAGADFFTTQVWTMARPPDVLHRVRDRPRVTPCPHCGFDTAS
jgi:hypothetical protein